MSSKKRRRQFTAEQKATIMQRMVFEQVPVSDLADEYKIQPSLLYHWQKQLQANLVAAFDGGGPKRATQKEKTQEAKIAALEAKLAKKDEVIAEVSEEFVKLKKSAGTP